MANGQWAGADIGQHIMAFASGIVNLQKSYAAMQMQAEQFNRAQEFREKAYQEEMRLKDAKYEIDRQRLQADVELSKKQGELDRLNAELRALQQGRTIEGGEVKPIAEEDLTPEERADIDYREALAEQARATALEKRALLEGREKKLLAQVDDIVSRTTERDTLLPAKLENIKSQVAARARRIQLDQERIQFSNVRDLRDDLIQIEKAIASIEGIGGGDAASVATAMAGMSRSILDYVGGADRAVMAEQLQQADTDPAVKEELVTNLRALYARVNAELESIGQRQETPGPEEPVETGTIMSPGGIEIPLPADTDFGEGTQQAFNQYVSQISNQLTQVRIREGEVAYDDLIDSLARELGIESETLRSLVAPQQ